MVILRHNLNFIFQTCLFKTNLYSKALFYCFSQLLLVFNLKLSTTFKLKNVKIF